MSWFEVDRGGLRQMMEGKDKSFIIRELVQNAWDEPGVTRCKVTLEPLPGRPAARLVVEDDAPEGFYDLRHAYTLFARTRKRPDPSKRGRFNLGEKQVLALCREARIITTTGGVRFDAGGERHAVRERRPTGSAFEAELTMTRTEVEDALRAVRLFIPPGGITTTVNKAELKERTPIREVEALLATEYENSEGQWRRTQRKTTIGIHEVRANERPMLYELGLPVVELEGGDRYHYNVGQRVPLNSDRDNVSASFLRDVRAEVANAVAGLLSDKDAAEAWAREATASTRISKAAFTTVLHKRYGGKIVSHSFDTEANHRAVAEGYRVLSGGALTGDEWGNARRFEAIESSAAVFPTAHPEFSPDGKDSTVPRNEWTPAAERVVELLERLAERLIGGSTVRLVRDPHNRFSGWYGGRVLTINVQVVGWHWFEDFDKDPTEVLRFAVHELAHQSESNHLSEAYYQACCLLGARCATLALREPGLFGA